MRVASRSAVTWALLLDYLALRSGSSNEESPLIKFLHQCQEHADLAGREALAREPVQIVARQVGDETPLVFAIRHDAGDQE